MRRDGIVLLAYILLALAVTFPLVTHFDTHVSGQGVDDPAQMWSLWWVKYALLNLGVSPLSTDYLFYPVGINLAAYTPTILNGVVSIPLQLVFGVIVAQNLLLVFAFVVSGYGVFLLTREILGRCKIHSDLAAAIAGAFFAFGAWHVNYADATYMLASNEWVPFYALYLIRIRDAKRGWRNGALAGLFLALATCTELTFVPFLAIFTALYLFYLVITDPRVWKAITQIVISRFARNLAPIPESRFLGAKTAPRNDTIEPIRWQRVFFNLIPLGVLAVVSISPFALSLLNDTLRYGYYLAQGMGRVQIFSAEPISFFIPSAQHPILGAWAKTISDANTRYAFIGYGALILAVLGFYFQRASRRARFWLIAAIFFALVMLGPTLIIGGQSTGIPMPFALLRAIPFVNANRYPVRFNVMLMLALTPLIAFGAAYLLRNTRGKIILGSLTILLGFEQLVVPIPLSDLRVPEIYQTIRNDPGDFTVLELPLGWRGSISLQGKMEDQAEFYATVHQKHLIGGITSRTPRFKFQYYLEAPIIQSIIALENGQEVDDNRRALDRSEASGVLRFFNVRYVDIRRSLAGDALQQYALDTFPMTEIYRDDQRTLYRINATASPRASDPADETARLAFDDRWGRAQFLGDGNGYRYATQNESAIWLPLDRIDQTVTFRLRGVRDGQIVHLNVNGSALIDLTLSTNWNDYAVQVPGSVLRDNLNDFTFSTETFPITATRQDDYAIDDTGVISPVDIAATGAGFDAGRFGEIFVAGKSVIESQRGYQLVAVNPQTGAVDRIASFDTFADASESIRLAQFIDQLPRGEIVVGVAIDDVSSKLQQSAVDALHSVGVDGDLRFQFRAGQAFIGVKGAQAGQAIEQVQGRLPVNVYVGKNVASDRAAFALGKITW